MSYLARELKTKTVSSSCSLMKKPLRTASSSLLLKFDQFIDLGLQLTTEVENHLKKTKQN